ncbi:protein Aster-C [Galendromus occidentalis]|uniref:Protein Aster-C n=1 Tax=Galendromus occidentalis TaxID=34638 RepID=A0AAJ6QXZ5_9ACAR|nr:protein Aster-C [Galendromus occidentalis]
MNGSMFAPPSVANARAAQALQAIGSTHIGLRDQNQASSTNLPASGGDAISLRKKSDPVLSKSAPSSSPDLIHVEKEKKSSRPTTPTSLDVVPLLQVHAANGTSIDETVVDAQESLKESSALTRPAAGSQESVGRSSVVSLQSSRNAAPKLNSPTTPAAPTDSSRKKSKKSRKSAWYNVLISPTYKSKCEDFRRIFKDVPEGEMLIVDYSCALQREILAHGRLYVTQNYLCFYANIFRWETTVVLKCKDITSMTKEKTALVIPNAIQCSTEAGDRYFFTSFAARDKSYLMLFRLWQNSLIEQPMSTAECWRWIHCSYGDELGLSTDDEDYIAPDDLATCRSIDIKSLTEAPVEEAEIARPSSASEIFPLNNAAKDSAISSSPDRDLKSSSSEEQDAEGDSCPSTHGMKKYLDRTFALDIDHTFTCLFTASEFYQELASRRKITNIVFGNWKPSDSEDVKQERALTYSVNVNMAIAKNCVTTEKQNLHRQSKPGKMYSVDCEFSNSGIPYADTFVVLQHICLEKQGENRCRLRLFCDIEFRKPVWVMKGLIERNTVQGTADFAAELQRALDREARRLAEERGQTVPTLPETEDAIVDSSGDSGLVKPIDVAPPKSGVVYPYLLNFLCLAVGLLLLLNVYLIHRSYKNEFDVGALELERDVPNTAAGWKNAYIKSQVRHRHQLEDLQRLVDRSLRGLENMRIVFTKVQEIVSQRITSIPNDSKSEL